MKIRFYGFTLQTGAGLSFEDLFSYLATCNGKEIEYGQFNRLLYVADVEQFHCGLLITVKDQKQFLELKKKEGEEAEMFVRKVSDGANLVDFNFFALHKVTGRGIYQHYHNSCSLNGFCGFIKRAYDEIKKARITTEIAALPKQTGTAQAKVRKKFAGSLGWQQLVRPETLEKLIDSFSDIKAFSFDVTTVTQPEQVFTALGDCAKKVSHRFLFEKQAKLFDLRAGIRQVLKDYAPDTGAIEGLDDNGIEQIIHLSNNPDCFGEFDYDEIAEKMTFLPKDFADSEFLQDLLKTANGNKTMFMTPVS